MSRSFFLWLSNWVTCPVDAVFAAFLPAVMAAMCVCVHLPLIGTITVAVAVHVTFVSIYLVLRQYGFVIDEDAPHLSRARYGDHFKR